MTSNFEARIAELRERRLDIGASAGTVEGEDERVDGPTRRSLRPVEEVGPVRGDGAVGIPSIVEGTARCFYSYKERQSNEEPAKCGGSGAVHRGCEVGLRTTRAQAQRGEVVEERKARVKGMERRPTDRDGVHRGPPPGPRTTLTPRRSARRWTPSAAQRRNNPSRGALEALSIGGSTGFRRCAPENARTAASANDGNSSIHSGTDHMPFVSILSPAVPKILSQNLDCFP